MGEVVKDEYQTDYVAGQDNINPFGLDLHNWVFPVAAIIVVLFVIGTLMFPAAAKETLDGGAKWDIIASFDWFFLLSANIFVVVSLALIFMPVGKIRLGGQDATPEFSTMSWFAMLFAAGMGGIGLMFWAVAEPVAYYTGWYETPRSMWLPTHPKRVIWRWEQPFITGGGCTPPGQSTPLWPCLWRSLRLTRTCH